MLVLEDRGVVDTVYPGPPLSRARMRMRAGRGKAEHQRQQTGHVEVKSSFFLSVTKDKTRGFQDQSGNYCHINNVLSNAT